MKKLFQLTVLSAMFLGIVMVSCRKEISIPPHQDTEKLEPKYSTLPEFIEGMTQVYSSVAAYHVMAYLDTLKNGYPDPSGRKEPLVNLCSSILQKLKGSMAQVESGVNDIFHFDGATFSLISYLMKARLVGDISVQTLVDIIKNIKIPPIPMKWFDPPMAPVNKPDSPKVKDCCEAHKDINPTIDILVTWTYKVPCGNYEKTISGYAVRDMLTDMNGENVYRFNAQPHHPCPGVLTSTITTPAGASYGWSKGSDGSVNLAPISAGTYTITFTYVVCGKTVSKTFTLTTR